jgi:hypothetical protein
MDEALYVGRDWPVKGWSVASKITQTVRPFPSFSLPSLGRTARPTLTRMIRVD